MFALKFVIPACLILAVTTVLVISNQSSAPVSKPVKILNACATSPRRSGLEKSTNVELQRLAEYESACGGTFSDTQMIFASMPATVDQAYALARSVSRDLKELNRQSVAPLVVFEPARQVNFLKDIQSEDYDSVINAYFQQLKELNINDEMMGTWVLFPEANTPAWGTTNPDDFRANLRKVGGIQKSFFPDSKITLLLNNQTYPDNDTNWEKGKYSSLVPYVKNLPDNLVDSFGFQGFPWVPQANKTGVGDVLNPSEFLRTDLITSAARELGVKDVWLNTGTFARAHTESKATEVAMNTSDRKALLAKELQQAKLLQRDGFVVSISLFAQDKSKVDEAVDWSYWQTGKANQSKDAAVLKGFIRSALEAHMDVYVYDSDHQ